MTIVRMFLIEQKIEFFMTGLDGFVENGFCELGPIIDGKKCESLLNKVIQTREFSSKLFLSKEEFLKNPEFRDKNPKKGKNNLAEKLDLDFIEKNTIIQESMKKVLGPNYKILLKKFIVSVPLQWIPDWIKEDTKGIALTNLGPYIRPEYSDMTYFIGVDFHQDLIDYKEKTANFVTLYVYLDDVDVNMSPLVLSPRSHIFGADTFPHNISISDDQNSIEYNNKKGRSEKFELKTIIGKKGSVNFWTAFTLHGTRVTPKNVKSRISLRYLIEKDAANSENFLIDELIQNLEGSASISVTRDDQDEKGKISLTSGKILEKN